MPHWLVYHPAEAFASLEAKQAMAADITTFYSEVIGLPAFYVVVHFILVAAASTFVGGATRCIGNATGPIDHHHHHQQQQRQAGGNCTTAPPFVRITVDHIARRINGTDPASYRRSTGRIDAVIRPHLAGRGYDYEFHIDETERLLWRVNGLEAPAPGSEGERIWKEKGRPVPLGEDVGGVRSVRRRRFVGEGGGGI
ncbi:hypothetical protein RB601_006025 [Gaeumannomyces tritici]